MRLRKLVIGGMGVALGLMPLLPSAASAAMFYEMDFPKNLSVSIELGADCVSTQTAGVHLKGENAAWVLLANDDVFRDGEWREFTGESTVPWTLTNEDGEKTVYAMFRSKAGNQSTPTYDSVRMDVAGNCGMPRQTATAAPEGTDVTSGAATDEEKPFVGNLRAPSFSTVYYVGTDHTRRPYMNPTIFATWETGFDKVTWVPDAKLPDYTLGAPMLPKAGVVLVKLTDADKVYWVDEETDGSYVLRWVVNAEVASANFGQNWTNSVVDIDSTLFVRYKLGNAITSLENISTTNLKTRQELARRVQ